jgi:hypothetical protein
MEHPVQAALGSDLEAPVRQDRHDLSRRQRCEFRLVAGEQDSLALLTCEAVRHQAVAAFSAILTVPITRKLTPPALQGPESHAEESSHLTGPRTGSHGRIEDLQCLESSDIRFWSSGDTKTGPPDGLLMGALRLPLDRCFIGGCRVVVVGCGI